MASEPKNPKGPSRDKREKRDSGTLVKDRTKVPRKFRVLMHNDDFTPMEFVVDVLEHVFHRTGAEATRIMLRVHTEGTGIAGIYSREVAETKATLTLQRARENNFPLLVSTEPE